MKNIEAAIFDMDGLIFDTERIYFETWSKVFKKYGYKMTKEVYASVMGTGRDNVKKVFIENYGANLPIDIMYKEKDEELNKIIKKGKIPLKKGVNEILDYLKEKGYKIALATSAKRERAAKHLVEAKIKDKFDVIVCGDEVSKSKPHPEIFMTAADKLGINNYKNCIVLEDSKAGIQAAFDGGMIPINIPDLKEVDDEIRSNSHKICNNLLQVIDYLEKIS
ncbi:MAG: HAD family hydrolase [Peptostreptococcaceae bacterium]